MIEIYGLFYSSILLFVWVGIVYCLFRVISLRKPGVRIWRDTLFNPFNLIWMRSKLTPAGLQERKFLFILLLIFFAMAVLPLLPVFFVS